MITQKFGKQAVFGMYKASGQAEAWTPHVRRTRPILTSLLLAAALTCSYGMAAESPVPLGAAGNFAVLAGSTVTSTGGTIVNGDLGVWPGTAVTGFLPGIVNGAMHAGDPTA